MNTRFNRSHARAGQAMIELMIGLIMILILLEGTAQFILIASAHTNIDSVIRGQTGFIAMSPLSTEDTPRYIQTWQPGADGQRFTADDQPVIGSPSNVISRIAGSSVANATEWAQFDKLTHPSSLEALHQEPVPLVALGFVGVRDTTTVPVSDTAQELFYNKSAVTVQEDTWLPIMNGLY